jgi:hypothetical protein
MLRFREESCNQLRGPFGFEFGARHSRCVDERAVGLVPIEEPFLVQPIERGHHGGVSERALQLFHSFSTTSRTLLSPRDQRSSITPVSRGPRAGRRLNNFTTFIMMH